MTFDTVYETTVVAGSGRRGACAPGGTMHGAAFGGAKIWNSKIWPVLAN